MAALGAVRTGPGDRLAARNPPDADVQEAADAEARHEDEGGDDGVGGGGQFKGGRRGHGGNF